MAATAVTFPFQLYRGENMKAPTLSYAGYCLQQTDSTPFMSVVSWGTDFPGRSGKVGSDLALNGTRKKIFKEKEKKKGKGEIPGFQQLLRKLEYQVAGGTVPKPEGSVAGLGVKRRQAGLPILPCLHAPWGGLRCVLQQLWGRAKGETMRGQWGSWRAACLPGQRSVFTPASTR